MANQKRSKLYYIVLWTTAILGIGIICSIFFFSSHIAKLKQSNQERQAVKTNAVKGKVWYERANKAHDDDNHKKELELLLKSADLNYQPAIHKMAKNYETGHSVGKSDLKSQEWAAKLPEEQYIQFLYRRGYTLIEAGQSTKHIEQGIEFLESAVQIAPENHSKNNALQLIGSMYSNGPESLRDKTKAYQAFERIGGEPFWNFLGMEGSKAEKSGDFMKARQLYQQAADAGSIRAKVPLAYSYSNDVDSESSEERVTKLIAEILESDEPNSRHQIAIFLIEYRPEENEVLGLEVMEALANSGFERSSLYLIDYYSDHPDADPNYLKTAKYIEKLTDMSTKTKVTLAHLKRTGTAITKNKKAAFKLYEEAANDGYIPAKTALAHMHRLGIGTPKDSQKAKTLYQSARHSERHPASYYIGLMYENGELGKVDMNRAITLYELAAQSEYGPALFRLAKLYETGNQVSKNEERAFKFMTEAAYTGNSEAIENLARYYSEGIGTEPNSEYAAIWRGKKEPRSVLAFPG